MQGKAPGWKASNQLFNSKLSPPPPTSSSCFISARSESTCYGSLIVLFLVRSNARPDRSWPGWPFNPSDSCRTECGNYCQTAATEDPLVENFRHRVEFVNKSWLGACLALSYRRKGSENICPRRRLLLHRNAFLVNSGRSGSFRTWRLRGCNEGRKDHRSQLRIRRVRPNLSPAQIMLHSCRTGNGRRR